MSALDTHVGKAVFQNIFQDAASGKTRILVTHALHFLPQVDYIYVISHGRIAEHGTFAELVAADNGEFARLMDEFGAKEEDGKMEGGGTSQKDTKENSEKYPKQAGRSALMQAEERNTGAIPLKVYKTYLSAARGVVVLPMLFISVVSLQAATVMAAYW